MGYRHKYIQTALLETLSNYPKRSDIKKIYLRARLAFLTLIFSQETEKIYHEQLLYYDTFSIKRILILNICRAMFFDENNVHCNFLR